MFLIDFSDHRVIALTVCLSIATFSFIVILIRFIVHNKKHKDDDISNKE